MADPEVSEGMLTTGGRADDVSETLCDPPGQDTVAGPQAPHAQVNGILEMVPV